MKIAEGEIMTRNSLLCVLASAILANCNLPVDPDDTSSDETLYPTERSALNDCTAHSDCAAPFDGAPVNCRGGMSCSTLPDRVVCDGVATFCHSPPLSTCPATFFCESGHMTLSCIGPDCTVLDAPNSKVCGGVQCGGVAQFCPPLPGDLECF